MIEIAQRDRDKWVIREASLGLGMRRNRLHEELEKTLSGRGNKKTKACSVQEDSKYGVVAHTASQVSSL